MLKGVQKKEEAKKIAKTIAESMLVKTAIFGNDPNWGRIACAVGYSGIVFDPLKLSIHMEDAALLINGVPQDLEGTDINTIIKQKEYTITVDIAEGTGEFSFLTSDLSYEYVKINAEYTT
jgi:glutamate N-acetyltransferase/amino-acid N-acetyltransferase